MKRYIFILILITISNNINAQKVNSCKLFGKIYFVQDKRKADFKVFIEEVEGFADLIVFQQNNKFFADKTGHWFITYNKQEADYWLYIEPNKSLSDFSIYYTDNEAFAGCRQ